MDQDQDQDQLPNRNNRSQTMSSSLFFAVGMSALVFVLNHYGIVDFKKLVPPQAPSSVKQAATSAASAAAAPPGAATPELPAARVEADWFVDAAKRNDAAELRAAVANKSVVDVDEHNQAGLSALYMAALHGFEALCDQLIALGADVNAPMADGATSLLAATFSGSEALAVKFVAEYGARVNATNRSGAAPIHGAALLGHVKLLQTLLEHGADVNTPDVNNITALHGAAVHLDVAMCQELLRRGARRSTSTVDGHTPLHFACVNDKGDPSAVINALLDAKAALSGAIDINARDKSGRTPLHLCVQRGFNESISLLLRRGADATVVDDAGVTPLFSAFPLRDSYAIKAFLEAGAPGINVGNNDGETALHWAALNGFPELTERLLNHSADVNHVDKQGVSAAHKAAHSGFDDVLRVLFARGADALATDARGRSLLHHGAMGGSRLAILMALSKGASINTATAADMQTILHLVCERAPRGLVAELVTFGADETRRDSLGRTPLHYCVKAANEFAVEELLNAGAERDARDSSGQTPADMAAAWPAAEEESKPAKGRATLEERKRKISELLATPAPGAAAAAAAQPQQDEL
jgi:ankyrin repeat protein